MNTSASRHNMPRRLLTRANGLANVLQSRGDLLSLTGKQEEALQAYDEAERLFKKEHDDLGLANVLLSRGDLLMENENIPGAKKCYEKALKLYKQEQVLEYVGYMLLVLILCCSHLNDENGLETYKSELEQILPSLPEHAQEKILMFFQE